MSMGETPAGSAGGGDIALTRPVNAAESAAGDTCPTCGGVCRGLAHEQVSH
jgi:hypothetical protein